MAIIKKIFRIILVFLVLAFVIKCVPFWIMKTDTYDKMRDIVTDGCYKTENILVEIGGNIYEFPRKDIYSLRKYNLEEDKHELIRANSNICYKKDSSPIKVRSMHFSINHLKNCVKKDTSQCNKISTQLFERTNLKLYKKISEVTKLQEICRASDFTKTLKCDFLPIEESLSLSFQIYLTDYPIENIDKTIEELVAEISSYKIENYKKEIK